MRVSLAVLTIACAELIVPDQALGQQLCDLAVGDLGALRSQVQQLPGAAPIDSRSPDFDVISVGRGQIWNFTKAHHPAHPSVACRKLVERDGQFFVETKLHSRASTERCNSLSADYARLDQIMMDSLKGEPPKR